MKKLFIHHIGYRLFMPLFAGIWVYVLILMIFDSIALLREHFFTQEAAFCVLLSYGINESSRLLQMQLYKKLPLTKRTGLRLMVHCLLHLAFVVLLVSTALSAYYHFVVGFSVSLPELMTFNGLFGGFTLLNALATGSMNLLNEQYELKIRQEEKMQKEINQQMQRFRQTINPTLFYTSLETLVTLVRNDMANTDRFIGHFSALYRRTLENQKEDLCLLCEELESAVHLLFLLNEKYEGQIHFEKQVQPEYAQKLLVPGTVTTVIEQIVASSIIKSTLPLTIRCFVEENYLVFQHSLQDSLLPDKGHQAKHKALQHAYQYFTDRPLIQVKAYNEGFVKIPLMEETMFNEIVED